MEFILNRSKEIFCRFGILVIVNRAFRKNIRYLLPNTTFARTNRADPFQKFFEIVLAKNSLALLKPFVIQNKALFDIFFQDSRCPNAEFRRFYGIYTISYGNNRIEIVKLIL